MGNNTYQKVLTWNGAIKGIALAWAVWISIFVVVLSLSLALYFMLSNKKDDKNDKNTITYKVTILSSKYYIDGEIQELEFKSGKTYRFEFKKADLESHPMYFSETQDGTHGGGVKYEDNVTRGETYVEIKTTSTTPPNLFYFCEQHSSMGNTITGTYSKKALQTTKPVAGLKLPPLPEKTIKVFHKKDLPLRKVVAKKQKGVVPKKKKVVFRGDVRKSL